MAAAPQPLLDQCSPEAQELAVKALKRISAALKAQADKSEEAVMDLIADHLTDNKEADTWLMTYGSIKLLGKQKPEASKL